MRILFLGDIVGKPGRKAIAGLLPAWRQREGFSAVIANGENAAAGFGLTPSVAAELFAAGVDIITLGNHTFANRDVLPLLEVEPRILRPANYPPGTPGRGAGVFPLPDGSRLGVLNLLGRVFLDPLDDPFAAAERELEGMRAQTPYLVVDFHAEATSEKVAFGWFLDGRAGAVIGTHTHVQTSDERILPRGTAYLTDAGMCGPADGVLGIDREIALRKFRTQLPVRFTLEEGPVSIAAVEFMLGEDGRAVSIKRHFFRTNENNSD